MIAVGALRPLALRRPPQQFGRNPIGAEKHNFPNTQNAGYAQILVQVFAWLLGERISTNNTGSVNTASSV